MSEFQVPKPETPRGPSQRWEHPEISCGDFITALPDGKNAVWLATGPAVEVWEHLSEQIRNIARQKEFRHVGISFFIYMIGHSKSTASPRIIFCSSDVMARKSLRKAVRQSDILKHYPSIGLGDSSSPLSRSESGFHPLSPRPTTTRSARALLPVSAEPVSSSIAARATSSNSQGQRNSVTNSITYSETPAESVLRRSFGTMTFSEPQAIQSYANSVYGSDSVTSKSSMYFNLSDTTTITSIEEDMSTQARTDSLRIKGVGSTESQSRWDTASSSESDSFSDSDDSDNPGIPENYLMLPQGFGGEDLIEKLQAAYASFRSSTANKGDQTSHYSVNTGQQSSSQRTPHQSRSRKRDADEPRKSDDCNEPNTTLKRPRTSTLQTEKILACPFWKKDPCMFPGCFRYQLKRVNHVKQHLYRQHKKPIRCPRCQTVFDTGELCNAHLRQVICEVLAPKEDGGISEDQVKRLNNKGPAELDQAQRWYRMWDIIFPGEPRPSSPYRDEGISHDTQQLLNFLTREGRSIILDHLRSTSGWSQQDEERFGHPAQHEVLDTAFQDIYRRFVTMHNRNSPIEATLDASHSDNGPVDLSLSPGPVTLAADETADGRQSHAGPSHNFIYEEQYMQALNDGGDEYFQMVGGVLSPGDSWNPDLAGMGGDGHW